MSTRAAPARAPTRAPARAPVPTPTRAPTRAPVRASQLSPRSTHAAPTVHGVTTWQSAAVATGGTTHEKSCGTGDECVYCNRIGQPEYAVSVVAYHSAGERGIVSSKLVWGYRKAPAKTVLCSGLCHSTTHDKCGAHQQPRTRDARDPRFVHMLPTAMLRLHHPGCRAEAPHSPSAARDHRVARCGYRRARSPGTAGEAINTSGSSKKINRQLAVAHPPHRLERDHRSGSSGSSSESRESQSDRRESISLNRHSILDSEAPPSYKILDRRSTVQLCTVYAVRYTLSGIEMILDLYSCRVSL